MHQQSDNPTDSRAGWPVDVWQQAVGISRSKTWALMKEGQVSFVNIGKRRIITISPSDFIEQLRRERDETSREVA